jgi:hypothetical protein
MSKFRTDVENLFLVEMAEEDMDFIINEDSIDDIIPDNTTSIFGDEDTSSGDDLDGILDGDDFDLF